MNMDWDKHRYICFLKTEIIFKIKKNLYQTLEKKELEEFNNSLEKISHEEFKKFIKKIKDDHT